jgi:uncharacterized protein (TIGR03437 family)
MDAAHKLIKTTGLLFVIALLMAAPGWSQTPALNAPTSVTLTGGSPSQLVTITSSVPSTPITFTIGNPDYSSDSSTNGAWLRVIGGTTTPASLQFAIFQTSGLSQGTHTASVTLTPDASTPGVTPVTISVTFNSGNGSGGSGTLTASPNPINLSASSGSQFTQSVLISTTSSVALPLGVSTVMNNGGTNWLAASLTGTGSVVSGSPATVNVTASAASLPNGTYTGTVTVTPGSGTALSIPVNFTVGGTTGGNGQWTISPNSIPFSYSTGGTFPSTSVVVTTTSGNTSYNATATSSNGWLLIANNQAISGLLVGQSYQVSVGAQAASLTTGSYTGTVSINDLSNNLVGTLSVTLSVNGGNSAGLTLNPISPLNLTSTVNGAQQNPSITVTSTSGGTLSVTSSSGTLQSWISVQLPSNTTVIANGSTTFSLNVNPAGLAAGTYSQSFTVAVGAQSTTLTVNLTVGGTGGQGSGTVVPTSLNFTWQMGTLEAAAARQKIVIPVGNWSSAVTTTSGGNWLNISPTSGISVPDAASSPTVSVTPAAAGLTVGSYAGNIAITTGGTVQNVQVSLTVTSGPVLVPTPGSLVFVAQTGSFTPGQSVFFSTTDPVNAPLGITATSNNSWITISGANPGSFSVSVDPTGMAAGVYSGSITVLQSGVANTPYTYPVIMIVNGGGTGSGPLNFNPTALTFTSTNGVASPTSTILTVGANVQTNFTYTTSVSGNVNNWISISPSNNGAGVTTTNLSVSVNPSGLTAGTYTGSISFNANGFIQTVPITLTVSTGGSTGGNITVDKSSLTYTGQFGATSLPVQSLTVSSASGSAPVNFTVSATTTSGGSWLSTSANASNSTPSTINVTVNPAGLAAGSYSGNLAIQPTGGSVVNVPVNVTISSAPTIAATPTTLTFNYRAGDNAPPAQSVSVTGTGLTYSATAVSNGNWLSVSPNAGTAPGTVNVSVNGSNLQAGTYNGTVTIAGTNGASGSTTVNVSLTVTAPLPTITKVTNAASYATGSISPGEIITLFADDPSHGIGPAVPVGLTLDAGKVATTIGGVQVLINGFLAPLVFVSSKQVSAVVPYELSLFTSATVFVKYLGQSSNGITMNVATTQPGLFTLNSSGTGPGAILNSNNSVNGPGTGATVPATRGDTVVVYMTGEGQTSPAGVTGKVTTVASAPPLTPGPLLPVSVTVGGQPANWNFAGEAPGFVSGVMQLNVQLPTNIGTGEQEILVTIGGNQSQKGVTVSVK